MFALFLTLLFAGTVIASDGIRETNGYRIVTEPAGSEGLLVTFELLDYEVRKDSGYHSILIDGAGSRSHQGVPDLPLISALLEVPAEAGIGLQLLQVTGDERIHFVPAPIVDYSEHLEPGEQPAERAIVSQITEDQLPAVSLGTAAILRDRRVVQISFAPCQIIPQTEELEIASRIEVLVSFHGNDFSNSGPLVSRPVTADWSELYHNLILNNSAGSRELHAPYGEYVICYPATARTALQPLIQWKRELGYAVDTVCTTTGNMDHIDIRNYLQDRWDAGNTFDYLLLVGDKDYSPESIPMDAFFIDGGAYAEPAWNGQIVTDHPYSMLEGDDYLSDIMVGRLSVDNVPQLQTIVSKILLHERDINIPAEDPEWQQRALMVCDRAVAWSRVETMRQIRDRMLQDGFMEVDSAYSHYWDPLPISTVYNPVNDGASFVNYRGYGMRNAWYTPYFTSYDITSTLHNYDKLPVVTGIVCGGGDFASVEHDPNFGETWLQHGTSNQPRGAVAFIGPSEEDTHTRWNNTIDLGIYQGVLQENLPRLGQAMARGKLELYLNNPNFHAPGQPSNSVHFYFHAYNLLGDPGLILTPGTPQELIVSHPDQVSLNGSTVAVQISSDSMPAVAYVTFYDAASDVSFSTWSGADGLALVPVNLTSTATLQLTVSGYGWIPYRATVTVVADQADLQLQELVREGDGELVMGEELTVRLLVSNGGTVSSAPCTVNLQGEGCMFTNPVAVPAVEPGSEVLSSETTGLLISDPGLVLEEHSFYGDPGDGELLGFQQLIHGRALRIDTLLFLDGGNLLPERGETATLEIHLTAAGDYSFPAGTMISSSFPAGLLPSPSGFQLAEELSAGATTVLSTTLTVAPHCYYGTRPLSFAASHDGYEYSAPAPLTVGALDWSEPGGPDAMGYRVYHSSDSQAGMAVFEWIELAPAQGGAGTALGIQDSYWDEGDDPLGETVVVDLPFSFVFYGQDCETISVCSNGWIAPGVSNLTSFRNGQIPGANGPPGMIAPLWDDLHNTGGGDIYTWYDVNGGRFYIEWEEFFPTYGSQNRLDFQVVLHDPQQYSSTTGDGDIVFHYRNWSNTDSAENYATVGIENHDETVGLEYSFNNQFLQPNQQLADEQSLWWTTGSSFDPPEVDIFIHSTELYLYWAPIAGAASYQIYSSTDPYTGYSLDESGQLTGEFWSAPLPAEQRFYRVTAVR